MRVLWLRLLSVCQWAWHPTAVNLAGNVTRRGSAIVQHPFHELINQAVDCPHYNGQQVYRCFKATGGKLRNFDVVSGNDASFTGSSHECCVSGIKLLSHYQQISFVGRQRLSNCNYIFVKRCLFVFIVVSVLTFSKQAKDLGHLTRPYYPQMLLTILPVLLNLQQLLVISWSIIFLFCYWNTVYWMTKYHTKLSLSSFHFNGRTWRFYAHTQSWKPHFLSSTLNLAVTHPSRAGN